MFRSYFEQWLRYFVPNRLKIDLKKDGDHFEVQNTHPQKKKKKRSRLTLSCQNNVPKRAIKRKAVNLAKIDQITKSIWSFRPISETVIVNLFKMSEKSNNACTKLYIQCTELRKTMPSLSRFKEKGTNYSRGATSNIYIYISWC